jgi:hypothetical protein
MISQVNGRFGRHSQGGEKTEQQKKKRTGTPVLKKYALFLGEEGQPGARNESRVGFFRPVPAPRRTEIRRFPISAPKGNSLQFSKLRLARCVAE